MQTTYSQTPDPAYPGQPADGGYKDDISCVVNETNGIPPGVVVLRDSSGDRVARLPTSPAADADAIKTNIASAAAPQALVAADFNGVIGAGIISPAAKIDLVLSNHTDWDATNATLVYEDEDGVQRTETIAIPNGGNATVTSAGFASKVISLAIPAQTGAGGTATLGVSATRILGHADVLGVSVRTHHTRTTYSSSDNEVYDDETSMPVRRKGRIYVECETSFSARDVPFVRCIAGASEQLGTIRTGTSDSGDAVQWKGARILNSGSAGDLAELEVNAT